MTIFGPDISSYQGGINIRALGASFVLLKCTEGTYYTDAYYARWLELAKTMGMLAVPYHFISGEDPAAQAAHLAANIIDRSLPVMLDWEPEGSYKPSLAQLIAVTDAVTAHGMRPRLVYAPKWYVEQLGSPSLGPLVTRGLGLVSSAYPGGSAYPGDSAPGWAAYAGAVPLLYQYTDVAVEGGQRVGDMNAYRGTVEQLAGFLGVSSPARPTPQPGGTTMGTIPPSIGQKWPDIADQFPANTPFDSDTALIWSDGGARAAALYALQARDAVNALAAKVDQLGQPPAVDVNALAAALAPLLTNGATADQVAVAVVQHLAATLQKG